MCHGNTNKDKSHYDLYCCKRSRFGMRDFDHEIIREAVDISIELQHKSVETGLSTKLKRSFK